MKRRNVYTGMAIIALVTSAVYAFIFLNSIGDVKTGLLEVINPNGAPQYGFNINGDFDNTLNKPMDIAATDAYTYVTDTNNKRVSVFDNAGNPLFTFGEAGSGEGKFNFPYGISVDKKGRVFVADLYNGKISIHDEKGKFIEYFAKKYSDDKKITAPGALRIINEKVYVTDIEANKVFVFNMDGSLHLEIGKAGQKEGEFSAPNGVTADDEGNIFVVDTGNQRIQKFDKTGKFLKVFNGTKDGKGESVLVNPRGIGIDSRGILYVVSNLTHMVYGFDQEGKQVFSFGEMGDGNGQFYLPNGLYVDSKDNVFISDTLNLRVSVYN